MAKKTKRVVYQPTEEEMKATVWALKNDYKIISLPTDNTHKEYYVQVKRGNKVWRSPETYRENDAWKEMYEITVKIYNSKK
jgi:hypothetical protein